MAWIAALIGGGLQLMAASEAAKNKTGTTETLKPTGAPAAAAQSVFGTNVPNRSSPGPQAVEPKQFIPQSLLGATLAGIPEKDLGAMANAQVGNPNDSSGKPITGKPTNPSWGNVLSAVPEAMSIIGPMLMNQQPRRSTIPVGAQGGGGGGSVVPGFGLPTQGMRRPTIGELLNSLPRARYG